MRGNNTHHEGQEEHEVRVTIFLTLCELRALCGEKLTIA